MADKKILIGAGVGIAVVSAYLLFKGKKPEEGIFRCGGPDNKDWQQYVNGQWITLEYDSPKCGATECIEGEAICIGPDRYRCVQGEWVLEFENDPVCTIPTVASLYGRVSNKTNGISIKDACIAADGAGDTSNDNGNYMILDLAPGPYTVMCSKDGFLDYEKTITLSKDTELNIQLTPVQAYPEVAQATCPYYDATTFYAPEALEKLFEHVLEKGHIDPSSPWCLFCGEEFEPEATERQTVRKVVDHWIAEHLDKLTAELGEIYIEGLPAQASPGDQITVKHGFPLEAAPGEYHVKLQSEAPPHSGGIIPWERHDFHASETGMYDYTETVAIPTGFCRCPYCGLEIDLPANNQCPYCPNCSPGLPGRMHRYITPPGLYAVISRCVYKQYNPDLERVVWEVNVGEINIEE